MPRWWRLGWISPHIYFKLLRSLWAKQWSLACRKSKSSSCNLLLYVIERLHACHRALSAPRPLHIPPTAHIALSLLLGDSLIPPFFFLLLRISGPAQHLLLILQSHVWLWFQSQHEQQQRHLIHFRIKKALNILFCFLFLCFLLLALLWVTWKLSEFYFALYCFWTYSSLSSFCVYGCCSITPYIQNITV